MYCSLLTPALFSTIQIGDPCVEALHALRNEAHMEIVATQTLQDVLTYTLVDGAKKTAILGCRLD